MAQGFFAGGNGTKESPFLIEDADDLNAMRMHLDSYFELINDINLSNGKYNLNQGWQPINGFLGVFDGKNHKIINLYINRPTDDFVGFFKNCYAEIKNVIFVDADVKGHNYVGVVMGGFFSVVKTTINNNCQKNITVINSKITGNSSVGGVCGIYADTGE